MGRNLHGTNLQWDEFVIGRNLALGRKSHNAKGEKLQVSTESAICLRQWGKRLLAKRLLGGGGETTRLFERTTRQPEKVWLSQVKFVAVFEDFEI